MRSPTGSPRSSPSAAARSASGSIRIRRRSPRARRRRSVARRSRRRRGRLRHVPGADRGGGAACVAVKPQLACFERLGAPGWRALERVDRRRARGGAAGRRRRQARRRPGQRRRLRPGAVSTLERLGRGRGLGADAATVNPLLGARRARAAGRGGRGDRRRGLRPRAHLEPRGRRRARPRTPRAGRCTSGSRELVAARAARLAGESGLSGHGRRRGRDRARAPRPPARADARLDLPLARASAPRGAARTTSGRRSGRTRRRRSWRPRARSPGAAIPPRRPTRCATRSGRRFASGRPVSARHGRFAKPSSAYAFGRLHGPASSSAIASREAGRAQSSSSACRWWRTAAVLIAIMPCSLSDLGRRDGRAPSSSAIDRDRDGGSTAGDADQARRGQGRLLRRQGRRHLRGRSPSGPASGVRLEQLNPNLDPLQLQSQNCVDLGPRRLQDARPASLCRGLASSSPCRAVLAAPAAAAPPIRRRRSTPAPGCWSTPPTARCSPPATPDTSYYAIARTTKLMTAYVARRELRLHQSMVTAPHYTPHRPPSRCSGSRRASGSGPRPALRAAAACGNDAAETLADGRRRLRPAFVAQMNAAARELGPRRHQLREPDRPRRRRATTRAPTDLVDLADPAAPRPALRDGSSTRRDDLLRTAPRRAHIVNRNNLVRTVPYVNGVKTGYTLDAGNVLVALGEAATA